MQDEELDSLSNFCADLVSLRKHESFCVHLLIGNRPAEWARVRDLCAEAGLEVGELKGELFATWLPDPAGEEGYATIIFYDEETMWTKAAQYNRQRLLGEVLAGARQSAGLEPRPAL